MRSRKGKVAVAWGCLAAEVRSHFDGVSYFKNRFLRGSTHVRKRMSSFPSIKGRRRQ